MGFTSFGDRAEKLQRIERQLYIRQTLRFARYGHFSAADDTGEKHAADELGRHAPVDRETRRGLL